MELKGYFHTRHDSGTNSILQHILFQNGEIIKDLFLLSLQLGQRRIAIIPLYVHITRASVVLTFRIILLTPQIKDSISIHNVF